MTNLPPSNLPFLKRAYTDIIQSEMDVHLDSLVVISFIQENASNKFLINSCITLTSPRLRGLYPLK